MRYTIRKSVVQVLGEIWQPGVGPCAMEIEIPGYLSGSLVDPTNNRITRDSILSYLDTHAGDFSHIIDFSASIEDGAQTVDIEWADEDNELIYCDAMYPSED